MEGLKGKAVVITGSGRGIGAACAKGVARQGAAVVVDAVAGAEAARVARGLAASGGIAVAGVADITDWDEAGRLIETCLGAFGRIDGLVNNAALFQMARLDEFEPTSARKLLDVNVTGTIFCAAHAVKPMLAQGSGSIVNVTSGAHLGMPTMGIYGGSKGAVASLTYTWAMELEGSGVRVNALSPFGVTRMMDTQAAYHPGDDANKERVAQIQPPEANSPVVEFLLSDRSVGVNGQIVRIARRELSLYVHPALQIPPATRESWTLDAVADAFDTDLRGRLVPCGVIGVASQTQALDSGFWARVER